MKQRELRLDELLRATDHCHGEWLSAQPEAARKAFAPLPMMRWIATVADGTASEYMLWMVNERVNRQLFDYAGKHPDLAYRLLASCGVGQTLKHQWLPGPRRRTTSNAAANLMLEFYPDANDAEIDLLLAQFDRAGFADFLDQCGLQPSDPKDVARKKDALKAFDLVVEGSVR